MTPDAPVRHPGRPSTARPNWTREEAKKMARLGGLATRGNRGKSIKTAWKNLKWCRASSCPIYPCPVFTLSEAKYGGECALKRQDSAVQSFVWGHMAEGRRGLVMGASRTLANLALHANSTATPEALAALLQAQLAFYRTIHGERQDGGPDPGEEQRLAAEEFWDRVRQRIGRDRPAPAP